MTEATATAVEHHRVAIIGTGFAGLGAAIRLRDEGHTDIVILEKASDLGGTWRDNTYPGCQCDVPSHLYSFSFAPKSDWTRSFAPQAEIWDYLRDCADDYDLHPLIRFDTEVEDATFDESECRWQLTTSQGALTADILIAGYGPLSEPAYPEIEGLESFEGKTFHSATWDHDHDLSGERVAVIGTGASAIQFVPQIQPEAGQVHLFQRTPPWIVPRPDRAIDPLTKELYRRLPLARKLARAAIYWVRELAVFGFAKRPALLENVEKLALRHLHNQVDDPDLREKLTPDYSIGCKRILLSNDYYPSLTKENVEVVTDGIREVRPHSIVTADGTEREVDTIIYGTGFHVTDHPVAELIRGRDGLTLGEHWSKGMEAYLGTTIAGFPNLFVMVGPNTGLGHTSMVFMMESQYNYILDALRRMDRAGVDAYDLRQAVQDDYNDKLHAALDKTVWNSGCASWYLDANGRNTTLWPTFTWEYRLRTLRFDPTDYEPIAAGTSGNGQGMRTTQSSESGSRSIST